jgi:hypothetical protein
MPRALPDPVVRDFASVQRNFERLRTIFQTFVTSVNGKKPSAGNVSLTAADVSAVSTVASAGGDLTGTFSSLSLVASGVTSNNTASTAYNRFRVDAKGRVTYANNGLEVAYYELMTTTGVGATSGNPLTQDHAFVEVSDAI